MSNNYKKTETPFDALTNESARQRWELFHRAIAFAKESNHASIDEADSHSGEADSAAPLLTIIR